MTTAHSTVEARSGACWSDMLDEKAEYGLALVWPVPFNRVFRCIPVITERLGLFELGRLDVIPAFVVIRHREASIMPLDSHTRYSAGRDCAGFRRAQPGSIPGTLIERRRVSGRLSTPYPPRANVGEHGLDALPPGYKIFTT